jgi:hypothetical protein
VDRDVSVRLRTEIAREEQRCEKHPLPDYFVTWVVNPDDPKDEVVVADPHKKREAELKRDKWLKKNRSRSKMPAPREEKEVEEVLGEHDRQTLSDLLARVEHTLSSDSLEEVCSTNPQQM